MAYKTWVKEHYKKHKKIVSKLIEKGYDKEEIIEYFDFENMKQKEVDFCPLYAKNKKCHDMKELNCYLCACPNFRFNDNGIKEVDKKIQYSFCAINSKDGKQGIYGDKIHQNCSGCIMPHKKKFISKVYNEDWMEIMKNSNKS